MPNAEKVETVAELREIVGQAKAAILTEYRGMTVKEVSGLRAKVRPMDAEYHVVKNTLLKRALGDTLTPEMENLLSGPTAVLFTKGDVVAPTKATLDFLTALKKQEIKVKGGFLDGKVLSPADVTALSKLPPKEQLIAQVVGLIDAPISEFVGTLDNIVAEFVRTVQAIADKLGAPAEGAAPAAEAA